MSLVLGKDVQVVEHRAPALIVVATGKPESDRSAVLQREHADIAFGGRGQAVAPVREAIGVDIVVKILVGQDAPVGASPARRVDASDGRGVGRNDGAVGHHVTDYRARWSDLEGALEALEVRGDRGLVTVDGPRSAACDATGAQSEVPRAQYGALITQFSLLRISYQALRTQPEPASNSCFMPRTTCVGPRAYRRDGLGRIAAIAGGEANWCFRPTPAVAPDRDRTFNGDRSRRSATESPRPRAAFQQFKTGALECSNLAPLDSIEETA